MRNLFRRFDRAGVEYLLISGQASVLYGAATFSEDIDLWVRPTAANLRRFIDALAARRVRVHKLTPPIESRFVNAGHGFHFVVPARGGTVYLDVMGRPPRVGSFAAARRHARRIPTDWGILPVVSIPDLVALKKTRRLADYDTITNLVQVLLSEQPRPRRALLRWAARNSFREEERIQILSSLGVRFAPVACRRQIAREVSELQGRDIAYWRPRLAELRRLRREGRLMLEGTPVKAWMASR
jgi:hypothetical protein